MLLDTVFVQPVLSAGFDKLIVSTNTLVQNLYNMPYCSMLPEGLNGFSELNQDFFSQGFFSQDLTSQGLSFQELASQEVLPQDLSWSKISQDMVEHGFALQESGLQLPSLLASTKAPTGDDNINSTLFDTIFQNSFEEKDIQDTYSTPLVDNSNSRSLNSFVSQLDSHFSLDNMQPSLLMQEPSLILVIAVLFEMLIPIPQRFKFTGVQSIFNRLAAKVNLTNTSKSQKAFAGIFMPSIFVMFCVGVVLFLDIFTGFDSIVACVVMILVLELHYPQETALQIYEPLNQQNNEKAKEQLYPFVLREVKKLSAMGIAKAASEGCILRIFNGWFAVMVWFLIGGIEGAVLMQCFAIMSRAFNYKLPNNYMFGRIVFIIFELMLSMPAFILGIVLMFSTNPLRHWSTGFKGMQTYPAPITGFVLGALGGALDTSLGGPRYYFGRLIRLPKVGGEQEPNATTILKSMRKMRICGIIMLLIAIFFDLNFM